MFNILGCSENIPASREYWAGWRDRDPISQITAPPLRHGSCVFENRGFNHSNWTFKELTDRYMTEHSKVKKRSWRRDENSLSHLIPFFGDCTLPEVTPNLISKYKAKRYKEGAKPAMINRELSVAKHSFNLGLKEWDWCRENPFSKVKMERENNLRDRVLTHEEEIRLVKASPDWLKEIITFGVETGARLGEILDLTWKEVNLSRMVVTIRQGKTGHKKTIPLTKTAYGILKERPKDEFVFPSNAGTRRTNRNVERAFSIAMKKAKITDLHFHDLRHPFASRLAIAGKDLYLIQKLLGHREPRMVQRYAHHSIESLRDGIMILDVLRMTQNGPQGEGSQKSLELGLTKNQRSRMVMN